MCVLNFNPRAPRGARLSLQTGPGRASSFQSTRPTRGATQSGHDPPASGHISIHAPHAGRDPPLDLGGIGVAISIHAPHAGRDTRRRSASEIV